ncbi:MAG: FliG C-terminal domain-containing protein [Candidatus Neomarinimicrobiota bacterium]
MDYASLSGLDKSAILFQVLGDGLAVTIFKELSDPDLRKIRVRARELRDIPFKLKKTILEEFYFSFVTEKFKDEISGDARKPFAFLEKLSDEQVAYLLLAESPRIVGMVLAQLSPERQMVTYERLDNDQRIEALVELGDTNAMNLEAIVSVASDLREKARYLPKASEFERGGGEKLAAMLNSMSMDQAELFLDKLSQENPELLKEVKRHYLTFDDIFKLPDNILRDVLNAIELDALALAAKGVDEETMERAIGILSAKKQAMYEPVEGAVSKREVSEARKKIMTQVRKLQSEGEINLADILAGDTVE